MTYFGADKLEFVVQITVTISWSTPMLCNACSLSISGLNGTATLSDNAMPVLIYPTNAGRSISWSTANWSQTGSLSLNMLSQLEIQACSNLSFSFNVTNSHLDRSRAPIVKIGASCHTTPEDMTYSPGKAAPLAQYLGMCLKKTMSQKTPWPGAQNSLNLKVCIRPLYEHVVHMSLNRQ
jgi:hypothetical protein